MPSTFFDLGAIISSILESLSFTLHLPSVSTSHNFADLSDIDHSQCARRVSQDLWIPVSSGVSIPIPNPVSYRCDVSHCARLSKGQTKNIPMVDITHRSVTKAAGQATRRKKDGGIRVL